ncbi:MAG: hypothetical protein ACJAR3_000622 [Roseivirga sp.]|jgi:hypothetical protein
MSNPKALYFCGFCFLVCFIPKVMFGQNIKVNTSPVPFSIFNMPFTLGLGVEQSLSMRQSVELGGEVYFLPSFGEDVGGGEYGYRINVAYRRYFGDNGKYRGFYLAPHLTYLKVDLPNGGEFIVPWESFRQAVGLQLSLGHQWVLYERISLGASFGYTTYRSYYFRLENGSISNERWSNDFDFNLYISLGILIFK